MFDIQALQGCRVLDVASFLAGPFAATQLAEFGAEVIKVELPGVGDATRRFGTMTECGDTLPWLSESRNKKCITLDLRKQDGVVLIKRLVEQSDVLIENFQPGTMERWGLGWDVLHAVNPRLIMVRIPGYGQTSSLIPRASRVITIRSFCLDSGNREPTKFRWLKLPQRSENC